MLSFTVVYLLFYYKTITAMKQLFIVAVAVFFAACNQHIAPTSTPVINLEVINQNKQTILLGHCSINAMQQTNYKEWYDK